MICEWISLRHLVLHRLVMEEVVVKELEGLVFVAEQVFVAVQVA